MIRPPEIVFTRRATWHVEKAARWWRENRPKGPDALREDLEQALQLIAANPEIGVVARDVGSCGDLDLGDGILILGTQLLFSVLHGQLYGS